MKHKKHQNEKRWNEFGSEWLNNHQTGIGRIKISQIAHLILIS